jgi:hypothetical protein
MTTARAPPWRAFIFSEPLEPARTTLGAALADSLGCIHADADTFYWLPTDPPFTTPRPREARLALLLSRIKKATSWVFSGSAISWAMPLERLYDLVVFLRLDPVLRMERLRRREIADYGARIEPGGDMELASRQFFEWRQHTIPLVWSRCAA